MSDNKPVPNENPHNRRVTPKTKNEQSLPKNNTCDTDKTKNQMKNEESVTTECTICYLPIVRDNEKIVLEECGHTFHSACIRLWMKQKRTCPFCAGFSLLPEEYPRLM